MPPKKIPDIIDSIKSDVQTLTSHRPPTQMPSLSTVVWELWGKKITFAHDTPREKMPHPATISAQVSMHF